ncbi:homoserine kinase [Paraoerskovia marina]|uniref:Homoserine kinase n=1 Tax=Paraoerskovia marina TaxID=545619 RepID=A0A1H1R3M0_9CELL|nr:homoserine kinase [Paraoerskovia marina]SDS30145.1 homoserine kinase [Paraoerskovia marina]
MRLGSDHVRVRVPATSANLGPGFDALGLALGIYDDLEVRAIARPEVVVEVEGEGAGEVPTDETHLVVRALQAAVEVAGAPLTGLHVRCVNRIPHGRGLGSSAAAVVAGITAARALVEDPDVLSDEVTLELATEFEGHPDNAAPAVLGGATVAWRAARGPRAIPLAVHADVVPTVVVPTHRLATSRARGVLPAQVPHADAALNAGRAALLTAALSVRPDLLLEATEDRLHQQYRAEVMSASYELVRGLRDAGHAATISGAGPTVLILATASDGARIAHDLRELVDERTWRVLTPGIDHGGVHATRVTRRGSAVSQ